MTLIRSVLLSILASISFSFLQSVSSLPSAKMHRHNSPIVLSRFFSILILLLLLVIILHPNSVQSKKILVLYPIAPSSHHLTVSVLTDELIRRGHTIHVVKWKEGKFGKFGQSDIVGYGLPVINPASNFTTQVTTLAMDGRDGRFFVLSKEKEAGFVTPINLLWEPGINSAAILFRPEFTNFFTFLEEQCNTLLSDRVLIHKLASEHFDLALIDMAWNECSLALVRALQIQTVVGFWLTSPSSLETDLSTTFLSSSHQAFFRANLGGTTSSIVDRIRNGFAKFASQLVMWIYFYHIDRSISTYMPGLQQRGGAQELQKSVDAMLINDHLVLGIPKPLPPNYLNVGGLQINGAKPPPTLPQDIQNWLDDAPHGVIFFSFGTLVPLSGAPKWIQQTFFQAFQRLPQKVLLQYQPAYAHELRMNGSISSNVKTFNWISQQSVLAHPNVKLFIIHGGQQSAFESIYAGIPMVVFPVVHDAPETSSKLVAKGVALELDRYYVTVDEIVLAVNRVLRDPSFKKNVQVMSKIMRHEMTSSKFSPLRRATDFLEYLLNRGDDNVSSYLKVPSSHVTLVQYLCSDILVCLLLIVGSLYATTFWIYKVINALHMHTTRLLKFVFGQRVQSEKSEIGIVKPSREKHE